MVVGGSDYDLSRVLKRGRSSFWTCGDMVGIKLHMSRSTALLLPRHGWSSTATSSGCSRVFFHTSPGLTRRRTLTSLLWEIPWSQTQQLCSTLPDNLSTIIHGAGWIPILRSCWPTTNSTGALVHAYTRTLWTPLISLS